MYKEKKISVGNKNGLESSVIPKSLEALLKLET